MNQPRIFVSHSHDDNAFCDALVKSLRRAGADVWYDEHNLGAGHLLNEIQRELLSRPTFLVILSKAAFRSAWVLRECQWAYRLYMREPNRIILPITAQAIEEMDFNTWLFLEDFKRIEAPGYKPLPQTEAIAKTLHALVLTPDDTTTAPETAGAGKDTTVRQKKVLWVDDLPSNNVFERRTLERRGIRFAISTSTDDALGKLLRNNYDAIISNMGRPPDSRAGYTLLGEVKRLDINIPFIIYSSSDAPEHKAEARARGAFGATGTPGILFNLVTTALQLSNDNR